LFKESGVKLHPTTKGQTDTGYQGVQKLHANSESPKKKSKKHPLTKEDKQNNRRIASERACYWRTQTIQDYCREIPEQAYPVWATLESYYWDLQL
jgi:hypothetical protein